jgi:putative hydrolase of the HAD superfamily
MTVRGVIFDLGGTLLHYNPPDKGWEGMEKIGAQGVYQYLREQHRVLPPESEALDSAWDYARTLWTSLDQYPVQDLKLSIQLGALAGRWGVDSLPATTLDALAQAYMTSVQSHVVPLDGAEETLQSLRGWGLRLGLISNTLWPGEAHRQDLDRHGLSGYLDHLVFSADVEAWKPQREVFQMALNALALQPDETVFVGDSLYHDIWGAQQAGLRAVWIEQPMRWLPDGIQVTPDATITRLPELPGIVGDWR